MELFGISVGSSPTNEIMCIKSKQVSFVSFMKAVMSAVIDIRLIKITDWPVRLVVSDPDY